ncbi:toxin-antitoxin system YwqK family antitoxin [Streptomyces tubercidicus]
MLVEHEDTYLDDDMRVHYEGELLTGEVIHRDGTGRMVAQISYVEGVPSGPQAEWHSDGSKKNEGQTRYGLAIGEWRKWYPNGQLAAHSVFSSEGCLKSRKEWDEEGRLTVDKSYTS